MSSPSILRRLITIAVNVGLTAFILNELLITPIYTQKELTDAREWAVNSASSGHYEGALERLKALFELAPQDQLVFADYLAVLQQSGQSAQALSLWQQNTDREIPDYLYPYLIKAASLVEDDELLTDLIALYNNKQPAIATTLTELTEELIDEGSIYNARYLAKMAYQQLPDQLDIAMLHHGQLPALAAEKRRQLANQLLPLYPANRKVQQLWLEYSTALIGQQRYDEALSTLRSTFQQHPQAKMIGAELMVVSSWQGLDREVQKLDKKLSREQLPPRALAALAQSLRQQQQPAEAESIYRQLLSQNPKDFDAQMGLALSLLDQRRGEQALPILNSLASGQDESTDLLWALAEAYTQTGQLKLALDTDQRLMLAVKTNQRPLNRWLSNLGSRARQTGNLGGRQQFAVKLMAESPELIDRLNTSQLLYQYGYPKLAGSLLTSFTCQKASAQKWADWGGAARIAGDLSNAGRLYDCGLKQNPENYELILGRTLAAIDTGEQARASELMGRLATNGQPDQQLLDVQVHYYRSFNQPLKAAKIAALAAIGTESSAYLDSWLSLTQSAAAGEPQLIEQVLAMQHRYPEHSQLRGQSLVLLDSLNRYEEALVLADSGPWPQSQPQVLSAIAHAARNSADYSRAATLYQLGVNKFTTVDFVAGLGMSLADLGDTSTALQLLQQYREQFGGQRDFVMATAYLQEVQKNQLSAAAIYQGWIAGNPADDYAYRQWVLAVNRGGAPELAIKLAELRKRVFDHNHWRVLMSDRAAHAVRSASLYYPTLKERQFHDQLALQRVDEYLVFLAQNFPANTDLFITASLDRIVALNLAKQHQQALDLWQQLELQQAELPSYVALPLADSLLKHKRPADAIALLEPLLAAEPNHHDALMVMFYAQLEAEQFPAAEQTLERAIAHQPEWRNRGKLWRENPHRLNAERARTMLHAYANKLDEAQQLLTGQLAIAPHNTNLQSDLATVYRWRGWARRALDQYQPIEHIEPNLLSMKVGRSYAQLDLRDYPDVELSVNDLWRSDRDDPAVQTLGKDWELHNRREFISRVGRGHSDGGTRGSKYLTWENWLYSSPHEDRYRGFLHHRYQTAKFTEGTGRLHRLGAGIEYRSRPLVASAELHQSLHDESDLGLSLAASWLQDDYWQFDGALQWYSDLVPLRATNAGIDGDSLELSMTYRWHEGRNVRLGIQSVDFSDGNGRKTMYANHYHNIYSNEHHSVALIESLYTSNNTEQNTIYFNPDSDVSLGLAVEYKGIIHRHYHQQFSHRLTISLGSYLQKSFGRGTTWDLGYEQRWQESKALSAFYGVSTGRHVYDGNSEQQSAIYAGLNWRF